MDCKEMILSEDTYDIITDFSASEFLGDDNNCYERIGEDFLILYLGNLGIRNPKIDFFPYHNMPKLYGLMQLSPSGETPPGVAPFDPADLIASGITQVQRPPLSLTGQGVILCFIDTGIDYENGNSRILAIWDQTVQTGAPPDGLKYGSEYRREDINLALRSEDPYSIVPSRDENGHGSILAGVAAGSVVRQGNPYIGAAPGADIVVVKLKECKQYLRSFYLVPEGVPAYQENDIMLGLRYLNDLARKQGMPLVICVALGTSFGGHNGDSILADILDIYATVRNRCVVVGTGNEAARRHHYFNRFTDAQDTRTAEIRVGEGTQSFAVELWSTLPNIVMVSVTSPSGERTGMIPIRLGYLFDFLFTFERTTITVEYRLLQRNNDAQLVFIRFQNAVPGIWKIDIKPAMQTTGDFHIWLPMEEFLEGEVYFLESNPDTTFTEPSGGRNTMTVAFYNSRENGVDINSGRGYTRDEKIKPDYAAPGEAVTGAVPGGEFKNRTGSSAATAIAAGGCALIMEWISEQPGARGVSSSQVRNIIVMGTQKLPGIEYPNTQWGYGTMNLYRSLDILRQL